MLVVVHGMFIRLGNDVSCIGCLSSDKAKQTSKTKDTEEGSLLTWISNSYLCHHWILVAFCCQNLVSECLGISSNL